ncbi:MAG: DNA repair protein RecO [Candidatus Paracaedibacteraceae bacterium]|nr:DNA repair protein RecO [Candidatus Paracaedibacteraceae bacterium]
MKWTDEGIVIGITTFAEDQTRLTLLTAQSGRQSGLFKLSKKQPTLQLGDRVSATWNARLSEHLGRFQIERLSSPAPRMFQDPWRLWLLQNTCSLLAILPDRHPYPTLFEEASLFFHALVSTDNQISFAYMTLLEKRILADLGFGIDLSECCVTHIQSDLTFISPKTGRAVSTIAAQPYLDKLLPLPSFWLDEDLASETLTWHDISAAFTVTGYFWQKWLFNDKQTFPSVRTSIIEYCKKLHRQPM